MTLTTNHNKAAVRGWSVSQSRHMSAIHVVSYRWLHFWWLVPSFQPCEYDQHRQLSLITEIIATIIHRVSKK